MPGPLEGLKVLDFSTLLPGPYATLVLAEAGATVLKVERPGGDDLRTVAPPQFPMINRSKTSVVADLKNPADREHVLLLADEADVLVEQFRPGVMARLGIGYEDVSARNPGLVYCSITGYGQTGERAQLAGHDLNYVAATGLIDLVHDADGRPVIPPALVGDIAGGAYPAVINILMALARRSAFGIGTHVDVAMADNVWPMQYWTIAEAMRGVAPRPSGERLTGGSPRYQIYPTADGRMIAAAPLEQRFWERFCTAIDLPDLLRDDLVDPQATIAAVADRIVRKDATHWADVFTAADCCCSVVASVPEAAADPAFAARGLFDDSVVGHGDPAPRPAMPVPLDAHLRTGRGIGHCPDMGELPLGSASWAVAGALVESRRERSMPA